MNDREPNKTATLVQQLEASRRWVDAPLSRPGRWRGLTRREMLHHHRPGEADRYAAAFNTVLREAANSSEWTLNLATLQKIHDGAVGGGEFRDSGAYVKTSRGRHSFPDHRKVPSLVRDILRKV